MLESFSTFSFAQLNLWVFSMGFLLHQINSFIAVDFTPSDFSDIFSDMDMISVSQFLCSSNIAPVLLSFQNIFELIIHLLHL